MGPALGPSPIPSHPIHTIRTTMKPSDLQSGMRVRYRKAWLRNTGHITGPVGAMRGTVASTRTWRSGAVIANVRWDGFDPLEPSGVLASNLEAHVDGRWRAVGRYPR